MDVPLRDCSTNCSMCLGFRTPSRRNQEFHLLVCHLNPCSGYGKICRLFSSVDGLRLSKAIVDASCWQRHRVLAIRRAGDVSLPRGRPAHQSTSHLLQSCLACEEQAVTRTSNREDECAALVPAVTLERLDVDPGFIPSTQNSNLVFRHRKTNLHFLEERSEENLSQRLLNLSRSNKVTSALELYFSMEAAGLQLTTHACNSLLRSLVRNGSLNDALRIFRIMRKQEMATAHTYSLMLKAVASSQGCDAAVDMFNTLGEDDRSRKTFDVVVYNTMISVCAKVKNWIETERLWRKLRDNSLRGTLLTYDLLVSSFVQCGQTELALGAYAEMIQNKLEPSEDIMKAIIASCTKEGKWQIAVGILGRMLNSGLKPNIIAFNSVINCLGKAGEDELAFRMYLLLKSSGLLPDVYTWNALLSALYRSNRYMDALNLFQGIGKEKHSQLNAHLYNLALMSCQKLGLWERALQILWQMESRIEMSAASYNHAISACEVAREPKVALQIYRHMLQRKCSPDTFTHLSLVRVCVWGSLWTELEEILECVQPNSSLYNALIHGLCLRGKTMSAKKLYSKMCNIGLKPDGKTRALMLQNFGNTRVKLQRPT